jgi:uncharacterized protein (DUF1330 family)
MSAYVISDLDVQDEAAIAGYVRAVPPLVARYGGRYIVRRGVITQLEGDWRPKALVIIEFPTSEQAKAWYASAEYLDLRTRFFKGATRSLVLVEGT